VGLAPAYSAAVFEGPVKASVVRILDGDTFRATAHVWPGQTISIDIRIRGIDAPEKRGRCPAERMRARVAREALENLLSPGDVEIRNIAGAKYHGRVLADVTTVAGRDVATALLSEGLVRPYDGGRRGGWC
jgi:endonuclease YncB( thermonuclease family)